jgi:exopolyphosphatase/guanosine-5'-triphosphate,3'-diphosphate pyrophosphatase
MRIAVLDLGTNTFNLLIVDSSGNDRPSKVFNEKLAPKIGQGGIISSLISDDAFERGLQCLEIQSKIIHSYKPDKTYVFGTSAIRNATNGSDFVREAKQRTGLDIHVIDGRREAELIYHGTRQAVDFGDQCVLILDIGGGSNEFILANRHRIFWKHSFEIGVSRLQQLLTPADPMSKHDVERIEQYVHGCIKPLYKAFDLFPASTLVGSSGAFET